MSFDPGATARRVIEKTTMRKVDPFWRNSLKHYSTKALGLGTAVQGAWASLPADIHTPPISKIVAASTGILLLWGFIGKFILQDEAPDDKSDPKT